MNELEQLYARLAPSPLEEVYSKLIQAAGTSEGVKKGWEIRKTHGKLGKGPIAMGEHVNWPVQDVAVHQFYSKDLEEGHDKKAVAKYMKQLATGKYEPIRVSSRYSNSDPLDGSHRTIAAHRLGMKTIKAYVEPGSHIHVESK
jgi:hypothetical protein